MVNTRVINLSIELQLLFIQSIPWNSEEKDGNT